MPEQSNRHISINILLFTTGILVFGWFIHGSGWKQASALAALALPCIAVYRYAQTVLLPIEILHAPNPNGFGIALIFSLLLGAGVGLYYRVQIGANAIPSSFTWFAPVAMMIGFTEEFVFRGAAYSIVKKWPPFAAISITAFLHASYKTVLFLQPYIVHPVDTWSLFYTTFLAGLVLGFIRHAGGSVLPTMAAHGVWDGIVYGDSPAAPWWVW